MQNALILTLHISAQQAADSFGNDFLVLVVDRRPACPKQTQAGFIRQYI
jgi:hypothetical protein